MSIPAIHVKFNDSRYNFFTYAPKQMDNIEARDFYIDKIYNLGRIKDNYQRCTEIEYFTDMPTEAINKRRRKAYAETNIHHRINFKKHNPFINMVTGIVDDLYYYAHLNMGIDLNRYWQTHSPHFINIW